MLRLRILSSRAGEHEISELPCVVGRAANSGVRLELPGIWDAHFKIDQTGSSDFTLTALDPAAVSLNGLDHKSGRIRNGDVIGAGGVEIEFGFTDARQKDLGFREGFVWFLIVSVTLGELALLYWLLA